MTIPGCYIKSENFDVCHNRKSPNQKAQVFMNILKCPYKVQAVKVIDSQKLSDRKSR